MIPKIIHYCWLSNDPVPADLQECMETWKKVLPDYEWMKWDFSRFDKSSSIWVSEAFDNKKYAFAADYIRLYALYNYGGFYLDIDVIAKKSLNPFLELSTCIGWQNDNGTGLEVAAFGVEKHSAWIKDCLDFYADRRFKNLDGSLKTRALPRVIEDILRENEYQLVDVSDIEEAKKCSGKQIPVFPFQFFSPKSWKTGVIEDSKETVLIHNFAGSWITKSDIFWEKHRKLYMVKCILTLCIKHPCIAFSKIKKHL